jgi:LmbE family N-acetylglucosaminyl deacetylase
MRGIDRRTWLGSLGVVGGLGLATGAGGGPRRGRKVIVAGGHPGDPEYGCGGTVARMTDAGDEVVLLYLNEGVPAGTPRDGVRVGEAERACAILGARPRFAGQVDGDAVVDRAHAEAFAAILEEERPDVVLGHWPIDHHADHRAIAMLVHDAWNRLGRRFALYYYEVSDGEDTTMFAPTCYVDVGEAEDRKRRACFAHASQAPERFYALQESVMTMRGIERGCRLAEGFLRHVQGPEVGLVG